MVQFQTLLQQIPVYYLFILSQVVSKTQFAILKSLNDIENCPKNNKNPKYSQMWKNASLFKVLGPLSKW